MKTNQEVVPFNYSKRSQSISQSIEYLHPCSILLCVMSMLLFFRNQDTKSVQGHIKSLKYFLYLNTTNYITPHK